MHFLHVICKRPEAADALCLTDGKGSTFEDICEDMD